MPVRTILWKGGPYESVEHCRATPLASGHRLAGLVLLPIDGRPAQIHYRVDTDAAWRSREALVTISVDGRTEREIALARDGDGAWSLDGRPDPALDGCQDVDLGFSPSTNTLPIRRLGLAVGERAGLRAAWLRYPELSIEPLDQSYERLENRRWRYRSGSYVADLVVDGAGLVLQYGDDDWTATGRWPGR